MGEPWSEIDLALTADERVDGFSVTLVEAAETSPGTALTAALTPVEFESIDESGRIRRHEGRYDRIETCGEGVRGEATVALRPGLTARISDLWVRTERDTWTLQRDVSVKGDSAGWGLRVGLTLRLGARGGSSFDDYALFAASANYNANDLDEDGFDDYLETRTRVYRDDRLNALSVMAYERQSGTAYSLARATVPAFDERPLRPMRESSFVQSTDIGSMGFVSGSDGSSLSLAAYYPFYEGDRSFALDVDRRSGWGAFWDIEEQPAFSVSYLIRVERSPRFVDAIWQDYSRRLADLGPQPVQLSASLQEIQRLREESLDQYFIAKDPEDDPNEPAGYALNCHPQSGEQLADVLQYGFTGQNTLNAWAMLRTEDPAKRAHAVKTLDFFVDVCHLPGSGLFYDLYNTDKGRPDSWWTGLLLPLAYADSSDSLEELMGPVAARLGDVVHELGRRDGSYLRTMSESAYGLLRAYTDEAARGIRHPSWLEAVHRFADFLVTHQEADGTWYRAYDHEGTPILAPERWFGSTDYERKSSTSCPIPTLVLLARTVGDDRYLHAARRAGAYVLREQVLNVRFNGGVQDSIYRKAQLVDNEGILFPMLALWALYEALGGEDLLDGATAAARLFATWTWLWDVPLPSDSTLHRYGFRSTGIGACDTCAAGYVHPFELLGVPELVQIGAAAKDPALVDVAELILYGCNQTVAVPGADWGLKVMGLQEEGYLISWFLTDDPIFDATAFGNRWKGEGNKTCFPWLPAVGMACHLGLTDRYGTPDVEAIRRGLGMKSWLRRPRLLPGRPLATNA